MTASGYPRSVHEWRRGTPLAEIGNATFDDTSLRPNSAAGNGHSQELTACGRHGNGECSLDESSTAVSSGRLRTPSANGNGHSAEAKLRSASTASEGEASPSRPKSGSLAKLFPQSSSSLAGAGSPSGKTGDGEGQESDRDAIAGAI